MKTIQNGIFFSFSHSVQIIFRLLYQIPSLIFSSLLCSSGGPTNCITHTPLLSSFLLGLDSGNTYREGSALGHNSYKKDALPQVCFHLVLVSSSSLPLSCTLDLRIGNGVSCCCLNLLFNFPWLFFNPANSSLNSPLVKVLSVNPLTVPSAQTPNWYTFSFLLWVIRGSVEAVWLRWLSFCL